MRPSKREANQLRNIKMTRHYTKHAEGSVLVEFGDTKVICTASATPGVPRFLKGSNSGWVTAEYGMLPRSTNTRINREAAAGKQTGRTQEIQRLIGRSLRACVDLRLLGENTIQVDCDVIQADGGTRTASITGACVALIDALQFMQYKKQIYADPFIQKIAAVSVGMVNGEAVLDLDYIEDSSAQSDVNVVMTENGEIIEVQGTAEKKPFTFEQMNQMMLLAQEGIQSLLGVQHAALSEAD